MADRKIIRVAVNGCGVIGKRVARRDIQRRGSSELALVESGRLTPIPLEFWPLEKINEFYERVKHGQVAGRAVLTPAS